MNFPEYRRARSLAYEEYQQEVQAAADRLGKALMAADNAFLEEQDEAVKAMPARGDR